MSRWYIIHAYSGFEGKVKESILADATRLGLEQLVEAVEVPTEKVTEVRRGKKITSDKKFFPGYVLAGQKYAESHRFPRQHGQASGD
jgi:transcriptional antiterminator NusG